MKKSKFQGQQERLSGAAETGVAPYLAGSQGMSQFRQGLGSQAASALATGGENALSNIRQRAQAAGFGFQQPITFGAEAGLQGELAKQRAQIPFQVAQAAAPLELQAAGQEAGLAQQAMQGYQADQQRKAALWGALAGIGTGLIPGVGLLKRKPPGDMSMGAGY